MDTQRRNVRRGYRLDDSKNFEGKAKEIMNKAGYEVQFLINRGYNMKSASTFVGNHYLLSERQRLALARMLSPDEKIVLRKNKEKGKDEKLKEIHIDGFNLIILLEVALSNSIMIKGLDGTIRDLSGLRGTYQIIDKTEAALDLLMLYIKQHKIHKAFFYLDKPVSNSGRLRGLIYQVAQREEVDVEVELENAVDKLLYDKTNVVTSDAIILNHCKSWYNMGRWIVEDCIKPNSLFELNI